MKYKIDIVYLDKTGAVLKVDSLKPNRWSYCKGANSVLEFKAGCAQMHGFHEQLNVFSKNDVTVIPIGERA